MQPAKILSPRDCAQIVANLDRCLAIFENKDGTLTVAEIRAKSLLTLARNEIVHGNEAQSGGDNLAVFAPQPA
jgi:hypothetical protein